MSEYEELNSLLRNFKFSITDLTSFENHIENTLKGFPASKLQINKGRAVYRCRKYTLPVTDLYRFESQFSYRTDLQNINKFGRCNVPKNSIFYGSMLHSCHRNQMKPAQLAQFGYLTTIFETSSLLNSSEKEGIEVYGVAMWEAKQDFEVTIIPPNSILRANSGLANDLLSTHEQHMETIGAENDIREFYDILGKEFSKSMYGRPDSEYGISALFSSHAIHSGGGIAYCSVKTDHKGFNIALSPQKLDDNFVFVRAGLAELWKFGNHPYFKFIATSERDFGIPLIYNDINNNSRQDVFDHFKNKGIKPNYILEAFSKKIYTF